MQIGSVLSTTLSPAATPGDRSKKIADAAKQFEGILLNQMLQSARAADHNDDDDQDSAVSDFSQQQFAQALANRGGLGIAKMVVAGLEQHAD
jgi:Rod binding domain-containing protein